MEQLLIHLLKSAALVSIFFLGYQLLLRNDTSFQTNRHYLLGGILASLLLPFLEFTRRVYVDHQVLPLELLSPDTAGIISQAPEKEIDWWMTAGSIYILGLAFFLLRMLLQLFSLIRILKAGKRTSEGKNILVHAREQLQPFSFFRYIVVNPAVYTGKELKMVLQHEQIHASQWHSADVLLSNLAAAILWFNPLSWWYKNSLIQNLEFIADKETVASAVPKKEYQYTLIKISVADYQPALANNFYQSLIKKRIIMLNKKPTHNLSFLKLGAILPFICAFMFFFNVNTQAQVNGESDPTAEIASGSVNSLGQKIGLEPLFVIRDKQYRTEELIGKSIQLKGAVTVLSKKEGQAKFGDIAKDGAIIISQGDIINDLMAHFQGIDDNALPVKNIYISVREGAKPGIMTLNKSADWETINASVNVDAQERQQDNSPLIIVDGEAVPEDFDINSINPENIATVNVYKGEQAIEAYGEEGKNGVVVIHLKKVREEKQVQDGKEMGALNEKIIINPNFNYDFKDQSAIEKNGEKASEEVIETQAKDGE